MKGLQLSFVYLGSDVQTKSTNFHFHDILIVLKIPMKMVFLTIFLVMMKTYEKIKLKSIFLLKLLRIRSR